jgi:hypothetical protein
VLVDVSVLDSQPVQSYQSGLTDVQVVQRSMSAADNEGHDETNVSSLLCQVAEKLRTDAQALYALVYHRLCIELGNLPRKPGKLCHHCRGESTRGGLVDVRAQFPAILQIEVVNASGVPKACDSREGSGQDVSEANSSNRGIAANTACFHLPGGMGGNKAIREGPKHIS